LTVWTPQLYRGLVEARTPSGHKYSYYTRSLAPPGMPAIPLHFLDCALYLYPSVEAARQGEAFGGSGFILGVPFGEWDWETESGVATHYAVTNSHVIRGGATVVRLNNRQGGFEVVPLEPESWIHHPDGDDIAIAPIVPPENVRFATLPVAQLVAKDEIVDFAPGTDVFMVGRFITHEGRQRNTPTVRFGNVAMLPYEPIMTERGIAQESFLVEVQSLPGYSGSPVFTYRTWGPSAPEKGEEPTLAGIYVRFLGIDWGHLQTEKPVVQPDGSPTSEKLAVRQTTGMAGVVPAWKLTELLEEDEVVQMRKEGEERWVDQFGHPDSTLPGALDAELAEEKPYTRGDFEDALERTSEPLDEGAKPPPPEGA
jgi:Trypsin-like peptidase domain